MGTGNTTVSVLVERQHHGVPWGPRASYPFGLIATGVRVQGLLLGMEGALQCGVLDEGEWAGLCLWDAGGDDGRDGAGAGGRHLEQPWGEEGEAP